MNHYINKAMVDDSFDLAMEPPRQRINIVLLILERTSGPGFP